MARMGLDRFSWNLTNSAYKGWPWRSVKQLMRFKVNEDHVLTTVFNASPFDCDKDETQTRPKCKTDGCEFFSMHIIGGYCSQCTTLQNNCGC